MTDLINYIEENVHCKFDSSNNFLIIKEDEAQSKIRKVYITGAQDIFKGFKLDCKDTGCLSGYVSKNVKGIRDACDCVLLVKTGFWNGVVFIELKSNTFKNKDLENKFKSTKAFVTYIKELYNSFSSNQVGNPNYQFILFTTKIIASSNPKRPVKIHLDDGTIVRYFYISEKKGEGTYNVNQLISN